MSEERKSIGAGKISKVPDKRLRLAIGEGAVKTKHIADEAITPSKVSPDAVEYITADVQNQIDSIQIGGWAISNNLGNDPHIGISQKALTELIGYNDWPDTIRGRIKILEDEVGTDTTSESLSGRVKTLEEEVGTGGSVDERINLAKAQIIGNAGDNYNTLGKIEDRLGEETAARNEAVSEEAARAQAEEGALDNKINLSVNTLTTKINTDIDNEKRRAETAEDGLQVDIDDLDVDLQATKVILNSKVMEIGDTVYDTQPTLNSAAPVTSDGLYRKVVQAEMIVGDPQGDWDPGEAEEAYERVQREIQLLYDELESAQLEIGAVQTDLVPTESSVNMLPSGAIYETCAVVGDLVGTVD